MISVRFRMYFLTVGRFASRDHPVDCMSGCLRARTSRSASGEVASCGQDRSFFVSSSVDHILSEKQTIRG
jgi:hypothetical protein